MSLTPEQLAALEAAEKARIAALETEIAQEQQTLSEEQAILQVIQEGIAEAQQPAPSPGPQPDPPPAPPVDQPPSEPVPVPPVVTPPVVTPPVVDPVPANVPKVNVHHIDPMHNSARVYFKEEWPDVLAVGWDPDKQQFLHKAKSAGNGKKHGPVETPTWDGENYQWVFTQPTFPGIELNGLPPEGAWFRFVALDGMAPFSGDIMAGLHQMTETDSDGCPPIVFGEPLCDDLLPMIANAHGPQGSVPRVVAISDPVQVVPQPYVPEGKVLFLETFDTPLVPKEVTPEPGITPDAPGDVRQWDCGTFDVITVRCNVKRTFIMPVDEANRHLHVGLFDSGETLVNGVFVGGQGASSALLRPKEAFSLKEGPVACAINGNIHLEDCRLKYDAWMHSGQPLVNNDFFRDPTKCPSPDGKAIGVSYENNVVRVFAWDGGKQVCTYNPADNNHNQFWRCNPRQGNPSMSGYEDWANGGDNGNDRTHRFKTKLTEVAGGTRVQVYEEGWLKADVIVPVQFDTLIQWWTADVLYHSARETDQVGSGLMRPDGQYGRGQFEFNPKTGKDELVVAYVEEQFGIRCQKGVNVVHWKMPSIERLAA